MNQDDKTNHVFGDGNSEDTGESTFSSNIEEDNFDHLQEVLYLAQARRDKSLRTTMVPLRKKRSLGDTVIAYPPFPNSRHLPAAMAPPLLKHQTSSLVNILSEPDHAPSSRALVLSNMSSGNKNIPQPKASSDQNVPQHQKATLDAAKWFMEVIIFTKTPWLIPSDDKYSMVKEAWNLAIDAQDRQRVLAGAPVGTPFVCQLPGGPSLKIDPQTCEAEVLNSV